MANLPVIAAALPLGQIGVDFDIPQSNLVWLQVDFGNQKSNRYARGNRRIFPICEPIYGSQNEKLSDAKKWIIHKDTVKGSVEALQHIQSQNNTSLALVK